METRLEDFQTDLIELRNLYSSPTSSLNLVLDGLLKKVKDLESGGGDTSRGYTNRNRSPMKIPAVASQQLPTALMSPSGSGNPMGRNGGALGAGNSVVNNANDMISYRKLTNQRMNGNTNAAN